MQAAPQDFVGQEQVALSTRAGLGRRTASRPRPLVMRAYVAPPTDGYCVMPGGLTRVSAGGGSTRSSPCRAAAAARTPGCWATARSASVHAPEAERAHRPPRTRRRRGAQPRGRQPVLARPLRRAARRHGSRFCAVCWSRLVGEAGYEEAPELSALVQLLVRLDLLPPRLRRALHRWPRSNAKSCCSSTSNTGWAPCAKCSTACATSPSSVRDRFSADTWRILNQLQTDARRASGPPAGRRDAGAAQPLAARPRRLQRHGNGKHDPRPRLALPRHRPPARTRGQCPDTLTQAGAGR